MGDLLVAHVMWLLGQDEQWMRPRSAALPIAAAAAAIVDLTNAGVAEWVDTEMGTAVMPGEIDAVDGVLHSWADRVNDAAKLRPIPVIHAINAVSPSIWESLGADLASMSYAQQVPRPVRRWLSPRRRPARDIAAGTRTHLREVINGRQPATLRDHGVLAVAFCAGVVEHLLSQTAFTDASVLEPTQALLEESDLVRRLTPAVSYLVSLAPGLGVQPSWPGIGS